MTDHVRRKHSFVENVDDVDDRRALIAKCAVSKIDQQILYMHYVDGHDFGFIADTLGIAYSTAIQHHQKALIVLQRIAKKRLEML